jgi:hypothetical protein
MDFCYDMPLDPARRDHITKVYLELAVPTFTGYSPGFGAAHRLSGRHWEDTHETWFHSGICLKRGPVPLRDRTAFRREKVYLESGPEGGITGGTIQIW